MKKRLHCAVLLLLSFSFSRAQTAFRNYEDGKIYFKLKDGQQPANREADGREKFSLDHFSFVATLKEKFHLRDLAKPFAKFKKLQNKSPLLQTYLLTFDDFSKANALVKALEQSGLVEYAEKVPLNKTTLSPNDPGLSNQWHLAKIGAQTAWNYFSSGSDVVIAIVDDAVQTSHPDLVPNLWRNPGEIAGNGIDDDRNGHIDDVNGWDFAYNDNDPNPDFPEHLHGTHVAGIASAATNNGVGVASVGYSCKLMCVKASYRPYAIDFGYQGILYAAENGAKVINCSWGGYGYSSTYQSVINQALSMGCIIVAGAGNDNVQNPFYPAAYSGVISVAATDANDHKAEFTYPYGSNYGSWVSVSAPGVDIYSTDIGSGYTVHEGTSMASPLVAGLVGLMRANNPAMSVTAIVNCLLSTATNINGLNPGYSGMLGAGRINAAAAMQCSEPACGVPTGLVARQPTPASVQLAWSAVPSAQSYVLQYQPVSSTPWTTVTGIPANSYSLTTGLAPGTDYRFRVATVCSFGTGAYSNPVAFSTTCYAPAGLLATNVTGTAAVLTWTAVTGAKRYTLIWRQKNASNWNYVYSLSTNSYPLPKLAPGAEYEFEVSANCSSFSSSAFFTTACNAPPVGVSPSNVGASTADIKWNSVLNADGFSLQWKPATSSQWTTVPNFTNIPYTLSNLTPGTAYDVRVATVCNGSVTAYGTPIPFTTLCGPPPTVLGATNITGTSATVLWSAVGGAVSYKLEWKTLEETVWKKQSGISTNSYQLNNLQNGSEYRFHVQAVCGIGTSVYSNDGGFKTPCPNPAGLTVSGVTAATAKVQWSAVSGAKSYTVQWRRPRSAWLSKTGLTTTSYTLPGLEAGADYEVQVKTVCSAGDSEFSPSAWFLTLCGVPTGLSATNITATSATLRWNAVANVSKFVVQWRYGYETAWTITPPFTGTSINLTGLLPGRTVYACVASACTDIWSDFSTPVSFATPCNAPAGLRAFVTSTSALLYWDAIGGIQGYTLQWRKSSGTWNTVPTLVTNSYNLTGLTEGVAYQFRVATACNEDTSNYSSTVSFTPDCLVPSNLTSGNVTDREAVVSWTAVYGASSYNLQWKPASSTTWTTVSIPAPPPVGTCPPVCSVVPQVSHTLSGLLPGSTYNFKVQTVCSNASGSNYTGKASFTTVCAVPTGLAASSITSNAATVSWTAIAGAKSYTLQWKKTSASTWMTKSGLVVSTYDLINLTAAKSYQFRVMTVCNDGDGDYSAPATFTTAAATSAAAENSLAANKGIHPGNNTAPVIREVELSVVPNPVSGAMATLLYKLPEDGKATVSLIDVNGRNLISIDMGQQKAGAHSYRLANFSGLANGYYIVVLQQNGKVLARKRFIIQK